jgi:PAS domain S-box-containing protein
MWGPWSFIVLKPSGGRLFERIICRFLLLVFLSIQLHAQERKQQARDILTFTSAALPLEWRLSLLEGISTKLYHSDFRLVVSSQPSEFFQRFNALPEGSILLLIGKPPTALTDHLPKKMQLPAYFAGSATEGKSIKSILPQIKSISYPELATSNLDLSYRLFPATQELTIITPYSKHSPEIHSLKQRFFKQYSSYSSLKILTPKEALSNGNLTVGPYSTYLLLSPLPYPSNRALQTLISKLTFDSKEAPIITNLSPAYYMEADARYAISPFHFGEQIGATISSGDESEQKTAGSTARYFINHQSLEHHSDMLGSLPEHYTATGQSNDTSQEYIPWFCVGVFLLCSGLVITFLVSSSKEKHSRHQEPHVFKLTEEGEVHYCNSSFLHFHNIKTHEQENLSINSLYSPISASTLIQIVSQVFHSNTMHQCNLHLISRSGNSIEALFTIIPTGTMNNPELTCIAQTAPEQKDEEVTTPPSIKPTLLDELEIGFARGNIIRDDQFRVTGYELFHVNQVLKEFLTHDKDEFLFSGDQEPWLRFLSNASRSDSPLHLQHEYKNNLFALIIIHPLPKDRFMLTAHKVHTILQSMEEKRFLLQCKQVLFTVLDQDTRFITINPAWLQLLGWDSDELMGMSIREFIHSEDLTAAEDICAVSRAERLSHQSKDLRILCKDGSYRWFFLTCFYSPEEEHTYIMAFDVTRRKRLESRLLSAKNLAEKANLTKGELLINLSEEIRLPLMGIQSTIQDILSQKTSHWRENLYEIQQTCSSLYNSLEDMMAFATTEVECQLHRPETFSLNRLAEEIQIFLQPQLQSLNVSFSLIHESSGTNHVFIGHYSRIRQSLLLLFGLLLQQQTASEIQLELRAQNTHDIGLPQSELHFDITYTCPEFEASFFNSVFNPGIPDLQAFSIAREITLIPYQIRRLLLEIRGNVQVEREGNALIFHITALCKPTRSQS